MKTSATNRRLRVLLTAIGNGTLTPQPSFQRRLVWSNKDKVAFIETVISGYPFPEIYVAAGKVDPKTGEGEEMLVDGQQRITTLYQYFKDSPDIKLPRDMKKYSSLSEDEQLEFLEYEVVVRDLGKKPIDEIQDIFQRINSTSYGLNAMEIHNARYGGIFKEFAEKLTEKSFFEQYRIFSTTDIKRMQDLRFVLGLIITIMTTYFNRDSEIEEYLNKYNEDFEQQNDVEKEFDEILSIILKFNFHEKSRAFKKADFFTLFVELHRKIFKEKIELDIKKTKDNLEEFYSKVDLLSSNMQNNDQDCIEYYQAALQGSNDRGNRTKRGEIIAELIHPR